MPWIYLIVAGLLEIGWAVGLKYSDGFTRPLPSIGVVAALAASVLLLGKAAQTLPIGNAYAIWTGIGAVGTVAIGILLLHEPANPLRLACVGLILVGIIGLKFS